MDLKRSKLNAFYIPRRETVGLNGQRCQLFQRFGVALSVMNTEKSMKMIMKAWEENNDKRAKGNENYRYQKYINTHTRPHHVSAYRPPSGIQYTQQGQFYTTTNY